MITYLWVRHKRESKKWEYKTVEEVALADELIEDDITTRYRRRDGDYPTGGEEGYYPNIDYFIPLREKKEDFPKRRPTLTNHQSNRSSYRNYRERS